MKKSAILLVVLSGMISISFNPFQRSNASGNQAASKNPRVELARMGDQAAIHAARRGNPYISLMDGRDLLAPVNGSPDAARLLSRNEAQPLSLASGDFDADGVADLLCGYAGAGKGVLTLYRGNVDALHPNSPGAMKRRAAKLYTDAPFLAPGLAFELPQAPDFLVAGDFDGDGKCDALAAARGSNLLHLLPGAGHGRLETAKAIDAGGRVTALVSGEINRADRIADVVVGIVSADGPKALIFEGPQGAMKAAPEIIRLPAEATSFALGHFDNDYMLDLAAAAGNELLVAHGRDRKLYLNGASRKGDEQARMSRRQFPAPIRALAAGDFSGGGRPDLALLTDDGVVRLLTKGAEGKERIERWKDKTWTRIGYSPAAQLVRSWVSSEPVDSLVIVDPARPQLRIIAGTEATERTGKADQSDAALETVGEPVAVLPMRLNVDALSDLVVLRKGSAAPVVLPTAPLDTFFVLSTADSGPGSLRDAIEQANVLSGPHEIVFAIGSVAQRASDGGLNLIRPAAETLDLQSPLPAITESVTIDGTTQSGYAGSPVIELNGANAGSDANGLTIDAGNSVVKGLAINRFSLNGISQSFADNCIFTGNFIGTDTTGTTNLGNGQSGIAVSLSDLTQIGGPLADERNLLSGNGSHGVRLEFVDNGSVVNNRIGTDVTGALDLGNGETGVLIIESSDNIISNNFISGNADSGVQIGPSIEVSSSNNIIQGNFIGTQADGTSPLGNGAQGILFHAAANNNAVGGAVTGAGNTIAFNGAGGVVVDGGSARNNILRNSIFSNTGLGIDLDSNAGGGGNGVTPNDPTDPDTGGNGLQNFPALTSAVTTGGNTTITGTFNSSTSGGFTFEFFSSPACDSSGNGEGQTFIGSTSVTTDGFGDAFINVAFPVAVPAGNVITATATSSLGDTSEFSNCVTVLTPSSTFVVNVTTDDSDIMPGDGFCSDEGGNCSLRAAIEEANASPDANTIHFNIGGGGAQTITVGTLLPPITAPVVIDGTTQPGFSGLPLIRLDGSGSVIPTATSGSRLEVAAIGSGLAIEAGGCTVRGLIITQFPGAGISLSTGGNNVVRGNFIGTDADGSANLGNRSAGVFIDNSPDNLIGGATAQDRNVISGNDFTGVTVFGEGATGNQIQGNFIGTNPAATAAVPNSLSGVRLDVTNGNTVGGTAPGAGNVISGNRGDGILLTMGATGNQIQGNFIGTQADGASPLGNTGDGIRTQDFASNNSIGVAGIAARNVIAFNQGAGANIGSGDGNTILFNSIFANAGLGIDLGGDGITPNDALDEDSGANTQLNFPVLTSAISTGGSTSVSGTFNSAPNAIFLLHVYSSPACDPSGNGEGQTFLGTIQVSTDAGGNATFSGSLPGAVSAGSVLTATATDSLGNTSEFSQCVAVVVPACEFVCPDDLLVSANPNECGASVNYPPPTTFGSCTALACTPPAGSFFPVGTTTVTCSVPDGPSCSFNITVQDNTPPKVVCPGPISVTATTDTAVVTFSLPEATDNCPGASVSCAPTSGSAFPIGVTPVTCTATDAAGNTGLCAFSVVVNDGRAPMISCPPNVAVNTEEGQSTVVVTYPPPTVSDNQPGVTVVCVPPSGSAFPIGTTMVSCTATDANNNQSACAFTVAVNSDAMPRLSVNLLDFGAAVTLPVQNPPSETFTIINPSSNPLDFTFDSITRTGRAVNNGKIDNPDDSRFFTITVNAAGSRARTILPSLTETIPPGGQRTFRVTFRPTIPAVADDVDGLSADQVLPDVVTSRVNISYTGGGKLALDLRARVSSAVRLIDPVNPRNQPVLRLTRSGNDLMLVYSIYDANLDVSRATYEFLDSGGQRVGRVREVNLAQALGQTQLVKGQSFIVEQMFLRAGRRSRITGIRLTVTDGETSASATASLGAALASELRQQRRFVKVLLPEEKY